MNSDDIKSIAISLGADLCGIASIDRFSEAPEGFHPCDVLPQCKTTVVFAKAFPSGTIQCKTTVPYTITRNMLSDMMDKLSVQFCIEMERHNIIAVPTGTIGPSLYDSKTDRWRNSVSAKHCAVAAGLGRIGKNTLVVTPEYGNMIWLTAVLMDTEFKADKLLAGNPCSDGCSICIDHCPAKALGNPEMDRNACFSYAFHKEEDEEFVFKCHKCRTLCPNCLGSRNRLITGK